MILRLLLRPTIMKKLVLIFALASASLVALGAQEADVTRWESEAQKVTIIRDDWGIAHVYGKTDADAVFGMEYAQAEDDFNRVETNYINGLGRLAEAEGESRIYQDLRMKLFINPETLKKQYGASPAWLKTLMNAFADGLNFYLYKHPEVKPRVIQRFEPWMALSFTEGSIGTDIERVNLEQLAAFYGKQQASPSANSPPQPGRGSRGGGKSEPEPVLANQDETTEPSGSNGVAIAPSNTTARHALLLINPHTSFYFRSELQMVSEEGLDAYGAVTWGQFFVYQGFNSRLGWMHTSSGVNAISQYLETVARKGDRYYYKYGGKDLPVEAWQITLPYKTGEGMSSKKFTLYRTQHGPVIAEQNGKWLTVHLMQEPVKALTQSYTRTKATDYKSFRQTMELHTNSSNNTIYSDADGDIAYFHGNFIPRRDTRFDWTKPVDGSNPATDWHGLLSVDESPHLLNPKSGWLYNSNDAPWSAAGPGSLKKEDFPLYVETGGESARGLHALKLFVGKRDFTLDSLVTAAFDSYLPWFEMTAPRLVKAWDKDADSDPLKAKLAEQIKLLREWDFRWAVDSVPTSLAVFWGEDITRRVRSDAAKSVGMPIYDYIGAQAPGEELLQSLAAASDRLATNFGTWRTPWGEINRFQRLSDDLLPSFDDSKPSIPVEFTSANWGSLASFGARPYPGTKRWYGNSGNSFVAVVEFGPRVRAKAVTAGGESGNPSSPHFNDEAMRYSTGNLREVYFYREQLAGHTERTYHPGN
jgi:acyl-homoserine-lactone acylase